MSENQSDSKGLTTVKAALTIVGLLPQIASLLVGASALSYLVGWGVVSAYYSELGAPWVTSLLSSQHIIQKGIMVVIVITFSSFLSVIALVNGKVNAAILQRWSIYLILSGLPLMLAFLVPDPWLDTQFIYICSFLAGLVYSVAAGLTIGELAASLANSKIVWDEFHVGLLCFVIVFGLLLGPRQIGSTLGQLHGDPYRSKLPVVSSVSSAAGQTWHLVTPIENRFLLVALEKTKKARTFRLVTENEVTKIHTHFPSVLGL